MTTQDLSVKKRLLQECMDRAVEEKDVAGCLFSLLRDGQEVLYLESGWADAESGRKVARGDIFRMYSATKPVTAAAAMKLLEEGRLDLCDPVGNYLESFRHQQYVTADGTLTPVPSDRPMQIRDLLNMTSGLSYGDPDTVPGRATLEVYREVDERMGTEHPVTTVEFAERIGACPLLFAPGSGWHYSVSADVLGAVIEKVSGMRFYEYLREAILEPSGMRDTAFGVPGEKQSRLITAYERREDPSGRAVLVPYHEDNLSVCNDGRENAAQFGGAGLFSTLDDYICFTQMLMRGGTALNGRRVLQPGTVRFMTSGRLNGAGQADFDQWVTLEGHSYAHLNRVMIDPSRAWTIGHAGEYGWDGWMGTYYANDPAVNQTMILMINRTDYGTGRLTRMLRNIVNADC